MCVENCTTLGYKKDETHGRRIVRALATEHSRSNSERSKRFEKMFVPFTAKWCKMFCVGWTRRSKRFSFVASADKFRGFLAFVPDQPALSVWSTKHQTAFRS